MTRIDDLFGRNYNIERSLQKDYNQLKESRALFEGKENADIFLLAMALGLKSRTRKRLEVPWGIVNTPGFSAEAKALIVSIAVKEGGASVLSDRNEIRRIAEEYANGGFEELKEISKSVPAEQASAILETEMITFYRKMIGGAEQL